jgi:PAS domain S-box-containing protein
MLRGMELADYLNFKQGEPFAGRLSLPPKGAMGVMTLLHQRPSVPLIAAVLGLTAGVFVLDLVLPLGITVAMLYAIPLLLTSKELPRQFTLGLAAGASCLTVLGFLLSPRGPELWMAVANRSVSLVTIWLIAILVIRNKRAAQGQRDQGAQLRILLEQLPAILWVADTNLAITFVQGRILGDLGLTPEGVVGTTVPEYFPLEPTSIPFATHLRALQGDPGSYVASFKERTLRAYVEPMHNPNGAITGCIGIALDITEQKQLEEQREGLIGELRNALTQIKTLRGLLPICAACKKIRDDRGSWKQIEEYIRAHSEVEFTHGICPECVQKLYPELSSSA